MKSAILSAIWEKFCFPEANMRKFCLAGCVNDDIVRFSVVVSDPASVYILQTDQDVVEE
jgi:hypothetical protein